MIEETIIKYLAKSLDVPVRMEVPQNPPKSFLVIEKTGGGKENRICRATVAAQSYGSSLYEAASLNEMVKTKMEEIIKLENICKLTLNSDYNFTDTTTKRYRYQAVFDIVFY